MSIDYKQYPPDWKEIRKRILERDEHKCKFCKVPNYAFIYRPIKGSMIWKLVPEGHEADSLKEFEPKLRFTKIILTIAHLDHDKTNHEVNDNRLAALCQRCHLLYDMDRHIANRRANQVKKANQQDLFK